jgi:hypothetical protein
MKWLLFAISAGPRPNQTKKRKHPKSANPLMLGKRIEAVLNQLDTPKDIYSASG